MDGFMKKKRKWKIKNHVFKKFTRMMQTLIQFTESTKINYIFNKGLFMYDVIFFNIPYEEIEILSVNL